MMKGSMGFMFACIAFMFAMLYVSGVFDPPRRGPKVFEELTVKTDDWVHVYRDLETGCQYIRVRDGITPPARGGRQGHVQPSQVNGEKTCPN